VTALGFSEGLAHLDDPARKATFMEEFSKLAIIVTIDLPLQGHFRGGLAYRLRVIMMELKQVQHMFQLWL